MAYEERLSVVGLTSLETRRLRADMKFTKKVYNILRCFEETDEVQFFQRRVGSTRGRDWKLYKTHVKVDAGKFNFRNRVCDK